MNNIQLNKAHKVFRILKITMSTLLIFMLVATPALADGDPLESINKLSTFIFSAIRAIGIILLGLGIMQIGLAFKSHDPSQRANGFLTLLGGLTITFAKEILDMIM